MVLSGTSAIRMKKVSKIDREKKLVHGALFAQQYDSSVYLHEMHSSIYP